MHLDATVERIGVKLVFSAESMVTEAERCLVMLIWLTEMLHTTVGGNAGQLAAGASGGLRELELLAKDGRRLVRNLDRTLEKVDRDPPCMLSGSTAAQEYQHQ